MNENFKNLLIKLDLKEYLENFTSFFARKKDFFMQGDIRLHFSRINELSLIEFNPPPLVKNLDLSLTHLSKQGILHLDESCEFVKIIRYFVYLKKLKFEKNLKEWLDKIEFPSVLLELCEYFDEESNFKESIDEGFLNINEALKIKEEMIRAEFKKLSYSKSLAPYLMDTQIHLINGFEALLVRGGFNHSLKAKIVGRSSSGGFYIFPLSVENLQADIDKLKGQKEELFYEYAKKISFILHKQLLFLKFINKAFDLFDNYSARILFAKSKDFEFVLPSNDEKIILKNFAHPALKHAKSVDLDFSKRVLIITGVNAGGKSMLLKSILCACILAKYLLPMRIKADESKIGSFKGFETIIEDPQNVKNDISTFAGRMLQFSRLNGSKNLLLGIDEIELGTDFEEAACLYSILIENLMDNKIIITTHHKRLAMLLAKNENVELIAALYDEKNAMPKYEFMKGIIGKSYAFETALRYKIAPFIIEKARILYGEDKQNLEELVGININLELELKERLRNLEKKEIKTNEILSSLKEQKERQDKEFKERLQRLEFDFYKAINEAKKTLDFKDLKEKQRSLNKANELKKAINVDTLKQDLEFRLGDFVKYENIKGKIIGLTKNEALIESDGLNLRIALNLLKKTSTLPQKTAKININIKKPASVNLSLDLHGLRSEEAIERLDKFISDALIAGLDEVIVYHGIGTGKLAFAVKEFLKTHKSVKEFKDATVNQGGFGAKIIKF
ncbi:MULTISPECIES: endonuclease MutS2 [unclassified Campylobacter]|uniref:endonuclease MutS2 n=1 Tax=unclassified Campylobacter TaxID=2593542 RepID=UPI001237E010|nr:MULTISPECIES: endonuclease MutS2 [unclassified Campylobacter]KAA6225365.1 endonuclease MutS2 [Campylobacter sp. LR185c]KAA6227061.1 endonuclease MutS2 [Campylobacter sp. LR196d]KAA6227632.1 endonuclease MutS2 [Campylobacter sp. LR286c]KAA6230741.1 endonuclease MutS2 [Campylobacter sp. LR291e]KAA8604944.1 endonuclease MutS2 [Campylobacter sp. LR185c]